MRSKSLITWSFALFSLLAAQAFAMTPDLNGDGKDDLLWQDFAGTYYAWLMDDMSPKGGVGIGDPEGWTVIGTPDLDGNGTDDLLWRHESGLVCAWLTQYGTGIPVDFGCITNLGTDWTVVHTPDLDGDDKDDLLWRHADGTYYGWLMDGMNMKGGVGIGDLEEGWTVIGTPDLDGNGTDDLLWRHISGLVHAWLTEDGSGIPVGFGPITNVGAHWTVAHTPDLDGDGKDDLLWRHTDGTYHVWLMNGRSPKGSVGIGDLEGWIVIGTPDLDGNGTGDLLWQNEDGLVYTWLTQDGTGTPVGFGPIADLEHEWFIAGASWWGGSPFYYGEDEGCCSSFTLYECCSSCIGPAGGVVEITDPDSPFYGVKIEIPPWELDDCHRVEIEDHYGAEPLYPAGFSTGPFSEPNGYWRAEAFDIFGVGWTLPRSVYMKISFPIQGISSAPDQMIAAFSYDHDAATWRIVLPDPDESDESVMVVKTTTARRTTHQWTPMKWSWGRVSLYNADYEESLAPLLEDLQGAHGWSQLETVLEDVYNSTFEGVTDFSCLTLYGVQELFAQIMHSAQANIEHFEENISCGDCHIMEFEAFWDGLGEYLSLEVEAFLIEMFYLDSNSIFLKVVGICLLMENLHDIRQIPCNYECYYDMANAHPAFYVYFLEYLAAGIFYYAIEVAKELEYISCETLTILTVLRDGDGSGTVHGSGIYCGSDCSEVLSGGQQVTLAATPDQGSDFSHWSGCDSTDGLTCHVTMNSNRAVTAYFTAGPI